MRQASGWGWLTVAMAALWIGCSDDGGAGGDAPGTPLPGASTGSAEVKVDDAALAKRGKVVYATNCIACHHRDPSQEGGLGPPIRGASRELLEARVLRAEYPPGYTPKADTRLMIPLPHLDKDLDALAVYLAAPQ